MLFVVWIVSVLLFCPTVRGDDEQHNLSASEIDLIETRKQDAISRGLAEAERRRREDLVLFPMYPKTVPHFPVRKDDYSNDPVVRGRFHLINGIPEVLPSPQGKRLTLAEFKKHMQCSAGEPALDELYGTMSQMLLTPPTRESVELVALWAETKCVGQGSDWGQCHRLLPKFKNKEYPKEFRQEHIFEWRMNMLRIIKGELYHDWPWGIERISKDYGVTEMFKPLAMVVNLLTDIKDSVFLFGGEKGVVPWTFNIAHITMAGSMSSFGTSTNSIVWPWEQEWNHELSAYKKIQEDRFGDFSQHNLREVAHTLSWDEKTETRAAFYASFDNSRWIIMEVAAQHPDLFKFSMNELYFMFCWTSACPEKGWEKEEYPALQAAALLNEPNLPGVRLLNYTHEPTEQYHPGEFKYVVVPLGMGGMSTSSRLLYLLAHCECVVLLVSSHLQYFITPRLVPWVHYVPLAASGADVAAKVRYLQQNDALARQIAQNGYNFGQSYLRLEDYLCYAASTVEALGNVMEGTSALEPFTPIKMF